MNLAIGVDLGATLIKFALVDQTGTIVWNNIQPTEANHSAEKVFENIKICIQNAIKQAQQFKSEIAGIGIGIPGIIDYGILIGGANNLPNWEMVEIKKILENDFNLPVFVDNDANLAGLAEVRYGSAKGASDMIFLTIGTGIGGAMILNGELYGGHRNRGGEFGHIIIEKNGKSCTCGARGCFEICASTEALIKDYKELLSKNQISIDSEIDGKFIVNKYLKNDLNAVKAMNNHFDYLATGISSIINIFSPEKVVIGGGISEAGDFYIENIRQRVFKIAMKETSSNTTIDLSVLGNKAGMLGAAALVFENLK
ncbi:ROK family protein [Bacteroidota bacterium]